MSGERREPWSIHAVLSLCPHVVEGVRDFSGVSFIKVLIPFTRVHPRDLITSQRPHLQCHPPPGVRISTYDLEGRGHRHVLRDHGAEGGIGERYTMERRKKPAKENEEKLGI